MRTVVLVVAALLYGCSQEPARTVKTRAERISAAEERIGRGPDSRTHTVGGNQLVVIEVPVRDGSGFLDLQRCFVWRDQEFKSATVSCGQQPEVVLSTPDSR